VDTVCLDAVRHELRNTPKWGRSSADDVEFVVDLMRSQAVAVAIISVNRDNETWREFIQDARKLHDAIVKDSRRVAGWASAANILKFALLGSASFAAMGHAIGCDTRQKVVSHRGLKLLECQTICDNEVEGPENRDVFKSFWTEQHIPRRQLAQFGVELTSTSVGISTDTADPALLLADYAAGLGLAHTLEDQGGRPLPLSRQRATELLLVLNEERKVVVQAEEFDHSYNGIFGHVMEKARELANA
jgi:hypothetical protein